MADIKQNIIINAKDQTGPATTKASQNLTKVEGAVKRLENTFIGFAGLHFLAQATSSVIQMSDAAIDMNGKIALVTTTTAEFNKVQDELLEISTDNGAQLEANAILFTRINKPLKDLNFTLQDNLDFTRAITEGLRISSATQNEAAAVVTQLSQAMQAGVLNGEELKSMMEQGGRVTEALATGLGVTTGALKKMGSEGLLTSEKVVKAILSQADVLSSEAKSLQFTFERSVENIRSEMIAMFQENTDFNTVISNGAQAIAENFDAIASVVIPALKIAIIGVLGLLVKYGAQKVMIAAATRNALALEAKQAEQSKFIAKTQAKNDLIRLQAINKETAAKAKQAKLESDIAVARGKETVVNQRAAIAALASRQKLLASLSSEYLAIIKTTKAGADKEALMVRQAAHQAKLVKVTQTLSTARERLSVAELKVTSAVTTQTNAYNANTAAQLKSLAANTRVTNAFTKSATDIQALAQRNMNRSAGWASTVAGNLSTVGDRVSKVTNKISAAMFGWPGLLAIIGIEAASTFVDLEVAAWAWVRTFEKVAFFVSNLWSFMFDSEEYERRLAAFTEETSKQIDEMLGLREAQAEGFKSIEAKQLADQKKAAEESTKIEQARNRQLIASGQSIKVAETALMKLKSDEIRDQTKLMRESDEDQDKSIKNRVAALKAAAEVEKTLLGTLNTSRTEAGRTEEQIEIETNGKVLDATLDHIERKRLKWEQYYEGQLSTVKENTDVWLMISTKFQSKMSNIDNDAVKALSISLNEMAKLRNNYLDSVKAGINEIEDLRRQESDFIRSMTIDDMTEYEKSADAKNRIDQARQLITKASQLDQIADADQIKALREQALSDLKSIATDEKNRADALKGQVLEELDANGNKTEAMSLYSEVIDQSIKAREDLNEIELKAADELEAVILKRTEALDVYQKSINAADELVAKQREMMIDADTLEANAKIKELEDRLTELNGRRTVVTIETAVTDTSGFTRVGNDVSASTPTAPDQPILRNSGGSVPGQGNTDSVPAMLTPGEFVINKQAVIELEHKYGSDALYNINKAQLPIMRNFGGSVNQQTIDRRVNNIRTSISSTLANTTYTPAGSALNLIGNPNTEQGNSWQLDYYDQLTALTDDLDGKDNSTVTNVGNAISSALTILERSNTRNSYPEYLADTGELNRLIAKISGYIATGNEFIAPEDVSTTTSASTVDVSTDTASEDEEADTGNGTLDYYNELVSNRPFASSATDAARIFRESEEQDAIEQAQGALESVAGVNTGAGEVLTAEELVEQQQAAVKATSEAIDDSFAQFASLLDSISGTLSTGNVSTGTSATGEPVETIVLKIEIGDTVAASGVFENDDNTKAFLEALKNRGLTANG